MTQYYMRYLSNILKREIRLITYVNIRLKLLCNHFYETFILKFIYYVDLHSTQYVVLKKKKTNLMF